MPKTLKELLREAGPWLLTELGSTFRYLYFIRFSLALWLFALILVKLNETGVRTLISGIVTPEHMSQYICVAFLVVTAGFVALISARVVLINGKDRFDAPPPVVLRWLLVNDNPRHGWLWETIAVVISQLPNWSVLHYLVTNGKQEQVDQICGGAGIVPGLWIGGGLAFLIWWVVNAVFYAAFVVPQQAEAVLDTETHDQSQKNGAQPEKPQKTIILGDNAARTILFPRWCFLLTPQGRDLDLQAYTLEGVRSPLRDMGSIGLLRWFDEWLRRLVGDDGYRSTSTGRLYEAHVFTIPAVVGSLCLYVTIGVMAAPVPAVNWSIFIYILLMVIPALVLCALFARLQVATKAIRGYGLGKWKWLFCISVTSFVVFVGWLYYSTDPERFPPFGMLMIMVIAANWVLSGVAFFADRYRIPVLTSILVLMILPRSLGWVDGKEEHYFSAAPPKPNAALKTPLQILEAFDTRTSGKPAIIVTATGGGLHASAWTAAVLNQLEAQFGQTTAGAEPDSFHDHLLLASSVSGGSVGLMTYLDQLQQLKSGHAYDPVQMFNASKCSSLEAVTWGLLYYDLPKAFVPVIPYAISPSSGMTEKGVNDLDKPPLFKDRTWALRKGFARNLRNVYCGTQDANDRMRNDNPSLNADEDQNKIIAAENALTLASLLKAGEDRYTPAFTMNTTTAEEGARFLLANYQFPSTDTPPTHKIQLGSLESHPADSFLDLYRTPENLSLSTDLPLATAAQLSATFPFVSSAARIPCPACTAGLHFIDGGYYDNDGTASAIEFLRSALQGRQAAKEECAKGKTVKDQKTCSEQIEAALPKLQVILVEIRNSSEVPTPEGRDTPRDLFWQFSAPLLGFWHAGHDSVTQRNRVGLDLLQQSFPDDLELKQIILEDGNSVDQVRTDPLNWSLTPRQRVEVATSAQALAENYKAVKGWFSYFEPCYLAANGKPAPATGPDCPKELKPKPLTSQ